MKIFDEKYETENPPTHFTMIGKVKMEITFTKRKWREELIKFWIVWEIS